MSIMCMYYFFLKKSFHQNSSKLPQGPKLGWQAIYRQFIGKIPVKMWAGKFLVKWLEIQKEGYRHSIGKILVKYWWNVWQAFYKWNRQLSKKISCHVVKDPKWGLQAFHWKNTCQIYENIGEMCDRHFTSEMESNWQFVLEAIKGGCRKWTGN